MGIERQDIVHDMLRRMEYKESPDKVCATCTTAEVEGLDLVCKFNPIYPFTTQPGATCAHHTHSNFDLNTLNK